MDSALISSTESFSRSSDFVIGSVLIVVLTEDFVVSLTYLEWKLRKRCAPFSLSVKMVQKVILEIVRTIQNI